MLPDTPPPHREQGPDKWTYYCTLVPGYVEKYGMRGIRDRNRRLLKELHRKTHKRSTEQILRDLAENNLPLAKYTAERWRVNHARTREQSDDDYQECCTAMWLFLTSPKLLETPASYFQTRLYWTMLLPLYYQRQNPGGDYLPLHTNTLENTHERLPFNEEEFIPDTETTCGMNVDLLKRISPGVISERDLSIVLEAFFGDPDNYIEPFNYESIAFHHNLTTARVWQIKDKTIEKLIKWITYLLNHHSVTRDDFIIEKKKTL